LPYYFPVGWLAKVNPTRYVTKRMLQIPPFQKNGKFKFTEGQLHKVVFDIKNPDDQEVSAAEYSVIE
jgi:hypothetical protein